jgi:chromosomal replication initiation ATPase DnaA
VKEKILYFASAPNPMGGSLPDLRSRLATILSVAVNPPDEEALKAVLFKLCSEHGMTLSAGVGEYILRRVERSFERVRALVTVLDHHTLSQHRQLTLGLVREVLSKI